MALLQRFSLIILLMSLVACGGGDGGFGTPDTNTDTGGTDPDTTADTVTMSLAISNANISAESPATVSATVLKGTTAQAGVLVTFALNNEELGIFDPRLGTSMTGDDGIATITLNAGGTSGAGTISATIGTGDDEIISTTTFSSAGDANTGSTPNVTDISLFASTQQIASSGAQEVTLTAIAKDPNNNLLENVAVTFTASTGQIEVINALTGPDGKASATLTTSNEPTNRIITTTATTANITDTVDIQVVGTTIQLTGSSSLAINDSNNFIINVLDSDGNGIGQTEVTLSSSAPSSGSAATITLPESVTTDFTGQATITVVGTSGGGSVINAEALGASASQSVSVQADSFLFTSFNNEATTVDLTSQSLEAVPDVLLSQTATATLTWLRSGIAVPDGTVVNFSATRGDLSTTSATTVDGKVSVSLTATNAGKSLITFSGIDGSIALNNQLEFEFIAESADSIIAQASPHSISPNGQQSTVSVVVTDPNGNLVKNKQIDFKLTDVSGGSIFPASAVTDSNGSASTVYTSNTVSAQDAVSIQATVTDTPTVTDTVTLTVADRELFISLGTGNQMEEPDITTYNKQFSVFVTDVDSTPVENVELTVSAVPKTYYKGIWIQYYDSTGTFVRWLAAGEYQADNSDSPTLYNRKLACNNEDKNLDGILDAGEDDTADGNGNGDGMLTPGNVVGALGNIVTDSNGLAIIDIRYPQSYGSWVDIDLIVSAKVKGTESIARTIFTLPTLSDDVLDEDVDPPTSSIGKSSPFGSTLSCTSAD